MKPGLVSLDSVLRSAAQQTGIVFSFNSKKLKTNQRINLGNGVITLAQLLSELEKKKIKIKIIENYIILSPDNERIAADQKLVSIKNQKKVDSPSLTQNLQQSRQPTDVKTDSSRSLAVTESKIKTDATEKKRQETIDSAFLHNPQTNIPQIKTSEPVVISTPDTLSKAIVKEKPKTQEKKTHPVNYFGRYGLTSDETLLAGVAAQFGFPAFYATISVNTTFYVSQFRYGVGTSYKIKDKLRLYLNLSTGNVERSGHFTDTARHVFPIAVKSKLNRISIAAEFSVSKKLKMQIGPVFNQLQTNYYINSVPSNLMLFKESGDHIFYAIKAPYLITNTFSPTTDSNLKSWIGLQASLYYSINSNVKK